MLLDEFNSSATKKFNKVNKLLKEEYKFTIPKSISSKKLFQLTDMVAEEIQSLKANGKDARTCPEISRNLLILEGLKSLSEHIKLNEMGYRMSGPYQSVIDWLGNFIADSCEVGDDFDDACSQAMKEYRSSKWRFPDTDIENDSKHHAIELLRSREGNYIAAPDNGAIGESVWDDVLDKSGRYKSGVSVDQSRSAAHHLKGSPLANVKLEPKSPKGGQMNQPADDSWDDPDEYERVLARVRAMQQAKKQNNTMSEKKVTEMRNDFVKRLRTLLESEVGQAESMVAAKGIGTDLQEMITKISRIQNETLPTVSDQMRDAYGPDKSVSFQTTTNQALQTVLDSLYASKSEIDNVVQSMVGGEMATDMDMDMGMDMGMEPDLGGDIGAIDDELGAGGELSSPDDELDAALDDFGGEAPLGRATKGSFHSILKQIQEMQVKIAKAKKLKESRKKVS